MIVAGFGFRSSATAVSLNDAFDRATQGRGVGAVATVADKAAGLTALATRLGVPVISVSSNALVAMTTLTQSTASRAARDVGSVAEAAALAAAGAGSVLLRARVISNDGRATCALAEGVEQ